jgi:hypothetical protein
MTSRKRTEIIFERERVVLYSGRYPRPRRWCGQCATEVEMITIFEAARLTGVSVSTVRAQANEGKLHCWTNDLGVLFVCPISL